MQWEDVLLELDQVSSSISEANGRRIVFDNKHIDSLRVIFLQEHCAFKKILESIVAQMKKVPRRFPTFFKHLLRQTGLPLETMPDSSSL